MKKIGDLFDVGGQLCRIYNISCEPLPTGEVNESATETEGAIT